MSVFIWLIPLIIFGGLGLFRLLNAPSELWREERDRAEAAEQKLIPCFQMTYDARHSVSGEHEIYRIRITNTGVKAVDDVEVRVVDTPSLPYLRAYLPMTLRGQHQRTGRPFTLNGGTDRYLDFLEYGTIQSANLVSSGTPMVVLCHDMERAHRGAFVHASAHILEVEVSGRDVAPLTKKFTVRSTLTATPSLQIAESLPADLSIATNAEWAPVEIARQISDDEPSIVVRYAQVFDDEDGGGSTPVEYLSFRNVGKSPVTNVSVEPLSALGKNVRLLKSIDVLVPAEMAIKVQVVGLQKAIDRLHRRTNAPVFVKLTLRCYDQRQEERFSVDYVISRRGSNRLDIDRLSVIGPVIWTDLSPFQSDDA